MFLSISLLHHLLLKSICLQTNLLDQVIIIIIMYITSYTVIFTIITNIICQTDENTVKFIRDNLKYVVIDTETGFSEAAIKVRHSNMLRPGPGGPVLTATTEQHMRHTAQGAHIH